MHLGIVFCQTVVLNVELLQESFGVANENVFGITGYCHAADASLQNFAEVVSYLIGGC